MNAHVQQRGALVVIAMVMLAGVAAVGASLSKMQVSGTEVAAKYTSGNKSFNMAESALQIGLKQFKDAECDPSQVTGAAPENVDTGATEVLQSLGENKSFKLTFCPMDSSCFNNDLMPSDEDVTQAENEKDDPEGTHHPYWHKYHGKHFLKYWYLKAHMGERYRHHHWLHTDKREHWHRNQLHRKNCHGRHHPHHNNWDFRCQTGGDYSAEEDSVNYWMVTAVDTSTGETPRSLTQVVTCESGPENSGNLFKGTNYNDWDRTTMIDSQTNGVVTFGTDSFGWNINTSIRLLDNHGLTLPNTNGQPVWFHATFPLPVYSDSKFSLEVRANDSNGRYRIIKCGENSEGSDQIELNNAGETIKCRNTLYGHHSSSYTNTSVKCDGSEDGDCKLSEGRLHFNLGTFDTIQIFDMKVNGRRFKLVDAYLGTQEGGTEATAKPEVKVGKWVENL
ncbi:MAG: hypothetical protein HQL86_01140 [Magnetococcales bacterium]|nr:hypothetical protein [Magnetococcales bacterium]